ncbi:MAG: hypothetical protein J7M34_04720 [Anaerolineae bacterium]|nr:hypothetical protein [Anaerolineae bacterium]
MTWAERVGDLATRLTLVVLTLIRIVTELLRMIFVTLDRFVTDLGEHSETGLEQVETAERAWVRLPGAVLLGLAFALLQLLKVFTVLLRQAAEKLNDFIVSLAEGEEEVMEASSS